MGTPQSVPGLSPQTPEPAEGHSQARPPWRWQPSRPGQAPHHACLERHHHFRNILWLPTQPLWEPSRVTPPVPMGTLLCPLSAGSHFHCALLTPKTGRNPVSLFLNAGHWRPWCSKSRGHKLQATCSSGQRYRPNGRLGTCPTRTSPLRPCVVSLPPVFQDCHPRSVHCLLQHVSCAPTGGTGSHPPRPCPQGYSSIEEQTSPQL